MTTSLFYPSVGSGRITNANASWPTLRASTNGTGATNQLLVYADAGYYLYRIFLNFDTSSIPDGATITGWSLTLTRYDASGPFSNVNATRIEVIPSSQANPNSLATADYDNLSFSSKGNKNLSDFASNNTAYTITGTNNDIINLNGWTQMCLVMGRDFDNVAPTGNNMIAFYEYAHATNKPVLSVTYTTSTIKKVCAVDLTSIKKIAGILVGSIKKIGNLA